MTTLKEKYDLARQNQKACQRAVFAAVDAKDPLDVLAKLQHDLDEATKERRRCFERYMDEH